MDLSGMIFVALAIAWAVYLIPKALRHHDEVAKSRSVDRFSHTMRVLARREPVNKRDARLVLTPGRAASSSTVTVKESAAAAVAPATPAQIRARRAATRRATARRRNVFSVILALNVLVAALAAADLFGWVWQAIPAAVLIAWLVACRLMVKSEIAADGALIAPRVVEETASELGEDAESNPESEGEVPADYDVARNAQGFDEVTESAETATMARVDTDLWDPLPITLPTYVDKPAAARRSVRTIDLGEPGAWTSGRTEESTEIAREAAAAEKAARKDEGGEERRAVGS
ncbi:MAG: hypothetical protein L0H93_19790 [Nocardioides sp.]|nr:hypothetical protein [Nocardioides sp.]